MTISRNYIKEITKNLERGDSTEHTHRPALKALLETIGKGITATNEPRRIACGAPDFNITRNGVPVGHVETKDVGTNLDEMERGKGSNGEQFIRYRDGLSNWILTDYLDFRWFVNGEKRLTLQIARADAEGKINPSPDAVEKLDELFTAFFEQEALTVGTAKELAQRMAGMARIIRDLIANTFEHEKEKGWLHNWLTAFRETLIPELDEKQFADMFSQTLAYGLFAACVHTPVNKEFSREMAAYNLPKTNPFLRKLFAEIAGVDMPDSIAWAVNDIVNLLKHADIVEILKDFGKGRGKGDPVVHFYETFLAAYDPKMREVRGVYYTPEPVVSYIVRSIDHLLKTCFNRPMGLADEDTLILDPATGTATFLYFVIDQIHQQFAKQAGAWDGYVAKHLLNRIFGFELLMAPYAVAHLKLGMQLQETGYQFASDQRLGVYLTNTLEEAVQKSEHLFASWVADEANAAAKIKRDDPILVVLGNPPYSGHSANRSRDQKGNLTFIGKLIEDYKFVDGEPLRERNSKWLQDDYVKFLRWGSWRIEQTGEGILAFITNHSYLDNPTFRGMRQFLRGEFHEIYIYNLHGNSKKKEVAPDGRKDENVFSIQQGVAIILCVKKSSGPAAAKVYYADLWGSRNHKYGVLANTELSSMKWHQLSPLSPTYLFVPHDSDRWTEYAHGWKITDMMPANVLGFQTHRDNFAVDHDRTAISQRIRDMRATNIPDHEFAEKYLLKDKHGWRISNARTRLRRDDGWERHLIQCLYRPFDWRWCYFSDVAMDRPRKELLQHVAHRQNLCINTVRQTKISDWRHVLVSNIPTPAVCVELKDGSNAFPLYLYPNGDIPGYLFDYEDGRRPNLSALFVADMSADLKLTFVPDGQGNLRDNFGPEDVFDYVYAVFHSPTYRSRYTEFLRIDFPRLPHITNLKLFRALTAKGAELVALHLMESPKLDVFLTEWPVKGDNIVEGARYTDKDKRVWINQTQYFGGVPKEVWEFHVGGYQVCQKWLKDRKGRELTYDDTQHYQKIVVALSETTRLMQEIDQVIRKHGDWPAAFT